MKAELPVLLAGFVPAPILDAAVRLSKDLLRRRAAQAKGDKALIDKALLSVWVTSLRHDTCGIPPYKDDRGDYSELLLIVASLTPDLKYAKRRRVQEMIHIALPYPTLLVLEDGPALHISALPPSTPVENLVQLTLSAEAPELLADLKVPQVPPAPHLKAVFERWLCAIHAQRIHQNPPPGISSYPYLRLATAKQAEVLAQTLHSLTNELSSVVTELKRSHQPQRRITLAKARKCLSSQIISTLRNSQSLPSCHTKK